MKLIGMSLIEPLFYHPVVVLAAIKGYYRFFMKKEQNWGVMVRQGYEQAQTQK